MSLALKYLRLIKASLAMKMTGNGKTISMVLDVNSALQRLKTGKMKKPKEWLNGSIIS